LDLRQILSKQRVLLSTILLGSECT
jgi:hypothetical protein